MKTYSIVILSLIGIASFIAEFAFLSGESHGHWWDAIPAFYALWGFLGAAAIILISKGLGALLIQQKEDYYDGE